LHDESAIINFINKKGFDVVTVIDTPWFYATLRKADFQGTILTESHATDCPFLDYLYRIGETGTAAVIVPSRYNQEIVKRRVGTQCPMHVVYNAIDTDLFHYQPEALSWEVPCPGLLPGQKLVCWVGRLVYGKRPFDFLQIARQMMDQADNISFWLVGGGAMSPQRLQVLREIERLGLKRQFHWLLYVLYLDMPKLYSLAARSGGCLISTSKESFPMVVEAMACRCPVICVNAGGLPEIIQDGDNGLFFTHGNVAEATAKLQALLQQPTLREQITQNAYRTIRENFTVEKMAARYLDLLAGI